MKFRKIRYIVRGVVEYTFVILPSNFIDTIRDLITTDTTIRSRTKELVRKERLR